MGIPASPMRDALARFLKDNPGWQPIADAIPKGRRPGEVATGRPSTSASNSTGGGFKESDYALREYHAAVVKSTSDGVFTFQVEPIKSVTLVGGGKAEFEPPPAP